MAIVCSSEENILNKPNQTYILRVWRNTTKSKVNIDVLLRKCCFNADPPFGNAQRIFSFSLSSAPCPCEPRSGYLDHVRHYCLQCTAHRMDRMCRCLSTQCECDSSNVPRMTYHRPIFIWVNKIGKQSFVLLRLALCVCIPYNIERREEKCLFLISISIVSILNRFVVR